MCVATSCQIRRIPALEGLRIQILLFPGDCPPWFRSRTSFLFSRLLLFLFSSCLFLQSFCFFCSNLLQDFNGIYYSGESRAISDEYCRQTDSNFMSPALSFKYPVVFISCCSIFCSTCSLSRDTSSAFYSVNMYIVYTGINIKILSCPSPSSS